MPESTKTPWRRTSAWSVPLGRGGAEGPVGVNIELAETPRLATVIARAGGLDELGRRLESHAKLPAAGRASFGPQLDLVWSAPDQWLAVQSDAALDLKTLVGDAGALTDQGDGRALLYVSGPRARDALVRGFAIDLHPDVFDVGSAAVTNVAHMSVQIWQTDSSPRYAITVPRSFAGSFWSWLESAAAGYGYEVRRAA